MEIIGSAARDGDGIAVRLEAGPRRGCYRIAAGEVPGLLAGRAATLLSDDAPVGDIAASRSLLVLLGAFRDGRGFVRHGARVRAGWASFVIPLAHLAAHYARHDGPVPVLAAGSRPAMAARPAGRDGEDA